MQDRPYTFTVKTADTSGNLSPGQTVVVTIIDLPPGEVRDLLATPSLPDTITLIWGNPDDDDFDHVEISWTPPGGNILSSPQNITGAETLAIDGLVQGTPYTFTVKTADTSGNLSPGQTVTATILRDIDGDMVPNLADVDDDNDGLIEIHTLEDLNNIRYNLAGTSYKASASDPGNTDGAPSAGLKGYELARNLDFDDD